VRILWIAVLGTQVIATLIVVYGVLMTQPGWSLAGFVGGYALVWFLVNHRVKSIAYRVFDPTAASLLSKAPADVTPQITWCAYELYEQRGPRRPCGSGPACRITASRSLWRLRVLTPAPTAAARPGG